MSQIKACSAHLDRRELGGLVIADGEAGGFRLLRGIPGTLEIEDGELGTPAISRRELRRLDLVERVSSPAHGQAIVAEVRSDGELHFEVLRFFARVCGHARGQPAAAIGQGVEIDRDHDA